MSSWDAQADENYHRINDTVLVVSRRRGIEVSDTVTPLLALVEMEEAEQVLDVMSRRLQAGEVEDVQEMIDALKKKGQLEGYDKLLREIFKDGCWPWSVVRRAFGVALVRMPELVGEMSRADLAWMTGETRAATTARVQKMCEALGVRALNGRKDGAKERMRKKARGNSNRAGNRRRLKVAGDEE